MRGAFLERLSSLTPLRYRLHSLNGRTPFTMSLQSLYTHTSVHHSWSVSLFDCTCIRLTFVQMALDSPLFRAELRVDPLSRCAALALPKDALAILPFYQSQAELDLMEVETSQARDVPYSPSFVLDLANDVDKRIRNVIDFAFLPGFHNPTIAVLCQFQQTWTGCVVILCCSGFGVRAYVMARGACIPANMKTAPLGAFYIVTPLWGWQVLAEGIRTAAVAMSASHTPIPSEFLLGVPPPASIINTFERQFPYAPVK